MTKKNKRRLLVAATLALILLFWKFNPMSRTEFVLLEHLTEFDSTSCEFDRIYLVKNPPKKSSELKYLVKEFEKKTIKKNENYNHLYIKDHDYILFPALTLSENIDYCQKSTARSDLYNIDFLVSTYSLLNVEGKRIYNMYMRVGEVWFYKE